MENIVEEMNEKERENVVLVELFALIRRLDDENTKLREEVKALKKDIEMMGRGGEN